MSQSYSWPPGFASVSIPSVGATGSVVPSQADLIGGRDPLGILRAVAVDASGKLLLAASAIDIGVVDQGNAGTAAQGWYTRLTDGSVVLGTSGNPLRIDPTGTTTQPVSMASAPLPSGAATEATLAALNAKVVTVDTGNVTVVSSALPTGAATEATLSALNAKVVTVDTGNVTVVSSALPTGAATSANQTNGSQQTKVTDGTNSVAVLNTAPAGTEYGLVVRTIPSGTQPVSGTITVQQPTAANLNATVVFPSAQPVSGTITADQGGTWNITNISGTISLPTGAATETTLAKLALAQGSTTSGQFGPLMQGAVTTSAPSYTTGQTSPLSLTLSGALRVDASGSTQPVSGTVTSNQGTAAALAGAWPVEITDGANVLGTAAHPIRIDPTGTTNQPISGSVTANIGTTNGLALDTTVSASQPRKLQDGSGNAITSLAVGSSRGINTAELGMTQANTPVYNDYTGTSIGTGAYVQLIASTSSVTREIEIFDSSGQALYLATGGAGSEANQLIIFPGGNGRIKFYIPAGTRVSAKAITGTANTGFLAINLYA